MCAVCKHEWRAARLPLQAPGTLQCVAFSDSERLVLEEALRQYTRRVGLGRAAHCKYLYHASPELATYVCALPGMCSGF